MSFLETLSDQVKGFGENVGSKLDALGAKGAEIAGFKNQLQGVFKEVHNAEPEKQTPNFEPLKFPEFYQKIVDGLIKLEKEFGSAKNLPEFMQKLYDTKAYLALGSLNLSVFPEASGSRKGDFEAILGALQVIVGIKEKYTPRTDDFQEDYKFGSDNRVYVRQDNGDYLPLDENKKTVPDDFQYKRLITGIKEHYQGLDGGYEVINQPPVVVVPIDTAKVAADLVNNPAGASIESLAQPK